MVITRKRIFILLSIPATLLLALFALTWWKQDEVKRLAIEQLNRYLKVPVEVGAMDFSLVSAFPSASIEFRDVRCKGNPVDAFKEDLLRASRIRLVFGWSDVFSGNIRFRRIDFQDAAFNVYIGRDGRSNTDVFKEDSTGTGEAMNFELSDVRISNTRFVYLDKGNRIDLSVQVESMKASGLFNEQRFDLRTDGKFHVEHLRLKGVDYMPNKNVGLNLAMMVDKAKDVIEIREGDFDVEGLVLHASGRIGAEDEPVRYDLKLTADEADLKGLLALLPGSLSSRWKEFTCDGKVYFDLGLKGNTTDGIGLSIRFGADNASIRPNNGSHALEAVRFKGTFTNRMSTKNPVEDLQVSGFEALLDGQRISGAFRLTDFRNPLLELSAKASIRLDVLGGFYKPDTIESMEGKVVADLALKGRVHDKPSWVSSGSVELENGSFRLHGSPVQYDAMSGRLDFATSRILVSGFSCRADGSDFRLDGTLDNVYAYLFSNDAKVVGDLKLTSRNLDLNELFRDKKAAPGDDGSYRFDLPDRIMARMQLEIAMLSFRKFQAWQLKGNIALNNKVISGEKIRFKAFGGDLTLQGRMDASSDDSLKVLCEASVSRIDVTELFDQLGNFGQEVMTDKNVKGDLTADVEFASSWSKELDCNYRNLYVGSKLRIENGELNRFEPLLALSRYLKGADLSHVRFATLENTIEIRNRTIFIPEMDIKSSVLDLVAAGTHTFDNQVDYTLELTLSQLLGRKVRDKNTEFGTIEDDGRGRMKLPLSMKGPMDNPRIKYNRKGVEKKIEDEVKKEKVEVKELLRKEFGLFKKDSALSQPRKGLEPRQELQIDTDEE